MSGGCRGAVHIRDAVFDKVAGAMELIVSNIDQSMYVYVHVRAYCVAGWVVWFYTKGILQQCHTHRARTRHFTHIFC